MNVSGDALSRLQLSLVVEPGDPRLMRFRTEYSAREIMNLLASGQRAGAPSSWIARAGAAVDHAQSVLERAAKLGMRWVAAGSPGWPDGLDDLDHLEQVNGAAGAPLGLWVRGRADVAQLCRASVAVVGARDATSYGSDVAADIAADVSSTGATVVSGAAFGIDVCAHRGALSMDAPTIAVLAGGADVHYPRAHTAILERISADGAVVSEQLPGTTPIKSRFLSRNRLIAALTSGTVVVEAARRSGSLNTLNWADQLGRVTMGVPGPVTSQASVGVHDAIRSGKAQLVTNGSEVLEAIGGIGTLDATPPRAPETAWDRLEPTTRRVLDSLPWGKARSVSEIASGLGIPIPRADAHLRQLHEAGLATLTQSGWCLRRRADQLPAEVHIDR